ncbi:uncharacterized protein LOC143904752 [Temnothorax americanus]|uniref:uncharacterized protein LOC143904752 n=1 Tax=Temnothorax americanus TaxID=1964332 RepID=UPI004067B4C8
MDSQEQIRVVYTCGLCEEICEKIPGHPCLEGYTRLYIDQNHYFYPMLDDGKSIVRRSMMPGNKEAIVMDNQENLSPNIPEPVRLSKKSTGVPIAKTARNKKLTDVEVELLILEVQKRTPLWDISSPLEKRNRETVRRLWNEVSVELNGKLDGTEAQKKFKSLRDTFRKFVQTEQHASGSARPDIKEKWKYYDTMEFLRDSCLLRPTHTNVSQDLQEEADHTTTPNDDDRDDISTTISTSADSHNRRSRRNTVTDEESASAINRIADALSREESNVVLPAPPPSDEVDAMLHAAGLQLRRLPYARRMETLLDIVQMVHTRVMNKETQ